MIKIWNILKANEEVRNLTARVDELVKHNEQLQAEVDTLKQREASYALGTQDWATEKESLVKGHAEALASLEEQYKKQLEEVKSSVNKEAMNIVSSIGLEPETIKVNVTPTEGEIVAKFKSLTGQEGIDFYQKHSEVLRKALWK